MKAVQTTRMVEQPYWACTNAEHMHATEPLANACIRASETEEPEFDFEPMAEEFVPVKPSRVARAKRRKHGV